jgi:hypothetical protein
MNENKIKKLRTNFKENKPAWIVGVLIIVLAVVALGMPQDAKEKDNALVQERCGPGFQYDIETGEKCPTETVSLVPEGCEPGFRFSIKTGAPCPQENSSNTPATTAPKSLSLAEALVHYEGNTFAVGADCSITPATRTVDGGTRIMVHNQSMTFRTVKVGGQTLGLKPYYYRTVPLTTSGNVSITCDGKQTGTVTVR